jgi:hypothetical protein
MVVAMKNAEDEAFDELARKQGAWGGGFKAKQAMAADKQHWNEDEWRRNNWRCHHGWLRGEQCEICNASPAPKPAHCQCTACKDGILHASDCAVHNGPAYPAGPCDCGVAQPAQEPVAFNEFLESQDFYELMQTYRHCLTDALLPFEEVKDALRAAHIGEMK